MFYSMEALLLLVLKVGNLLLYYNNVFRYFVLNVSITWFWYWFSVEYHAAVKKYVYKIRYGLRKCTWIIFHSITSKYSIFIVKTFSKSCIVPFSFPSIFLINQLHLWNAHYEKHSVLFLSTGVAMTWASMELRVGIATLKVYYQCLKSIVLFSKLFWR